MSLQCQKVEIKKIPFLASDITNFTSAVCAVVLEMSTIGEPIFETWANTYSSDLYSSYTTVYSYSSDWANADLEVNNFVYSTSANILSVNAAVNEYSANWNSVYSEFNSVSSNLVTFVSGDTRYVKLSGDIMFGGLSAPSISADTIYVGNSTINFFDENFQVVENLKGSDVTKFKSNYNTVNSKSALWDDVYNEFSSQSADNTSVYNTVHDSSGNWNYSYHTILTGGTIGGNLNVNGNLSAQTLQTNYIDFSASMLASPPYKEGRMFYNPDDNTLQLYVDNPDVALNVGQEMWVLGVNKTGSLIPDGTVVYLSGAQGNRPKMWPALANSDLKSADTIGVVTHEVAINAEGYITTEGIINGINTSNFNDGEVLYLSPIIPGAVTNVKPVAPQHLVKVGYALNSTNNGKIFVTVDNGYELDELHNVRITSPQSGQIIKYNSVSSIWVNGDEYNGNDIKSLTAEWNNTSSLFSAQSANNLSVYNTVNSYSATQWNYQGNDVKSLTGNWNSTYNTVETYSGNWNYQGNDIKALTSNWENTYTQFSLQSADNLNITTVVENNSSTWGAADIPQVLSFNESNAELSISNGNTVSLSSLSGGTGPSGEPLFTSWAQTYSGNYDSVYSTVQSNSSTTWNYQGNDIKALSSNWENTYNSFSVQSANNLSVYNTVQTNSSTTWNYQGTDVKILTANWENTYTTVQTNSAQWAVDSTIDVGVRSLTSNWQDTYTNFSTQSANNSSVYSTVNTNSATSWNYQGTDIKVLTANWQDTYTNFSAQSSNNSSVYSTVQTNSGTWGSGGTIDTEVRALTSNWQSTYNTVNTTSANIGIAALGITIDGAGSAITTGSKGVISIPYNATIQSATIVAAQTGSIVIDVKKSSYADFPTTTSICAAAKPTLSTAQKNTDSTLTGWTKTITAGDILEFVVDSASTVTKVTLTLKVVKY